MGLVVVSVLTSSAAGAPDRDGQALASVPLEMTRHGSVVQARVNGEGPFSLIVDSSAEITFLSPNVVEALGDEVVVIRSAEGIYDQNAREKATIRVGAITFGDLTLKDILAVVVDVTTVFGENETPAGLLGFDLFAGYLLTIDSPGERLRIGRGELPPADGKGVFDYTVVEVKNAPGRYPAIRLQVEDQALRARLDLASSGEIMLPTEFMKTLPLAGEPGRMAMARTPDGDFDILGSTLDGTAVIGSHNLERPRLQFSELYDDASLGADLLNRFALTFDQVNRRVRFEQPADYRDPLHEKAAHIKPVSGVGDDLRTVFNRHTEEVQLMMILSPT
jgi:hypothetical protein